MQLVTWHGSTKHRTGLGHGVEIARAISIKTIDYLHRWEKQQTWYLIEKNNKHNANEKDSHHRWKYILYWCIIFFYQILYKSEKMNPLKPNGVLIDRFQRRIFSSLINRMIYFIRINSQITKNNREEQKKSLFIVDQLTLIITPKILFHYSSLSLAAE